MGLNDKKISEFPEAIELMSNAYIPIVQGYPTDDYKISKDALFNQLSAGGASKDYVDQQDNLIYEYIDDKLSGVTIDTSHLVPYTGSTQDIDINDKSINSVTSIGLSNGETIQWDDVENTLSYSLPDGGDISIGKEMFDYYTNIDTVDLVNGDIVSIYPISGNRKGIKRTDFTNGDSVKNMVGMVTVTTIIMNELGRITTVGEVHELNTNAYNEGEQIYGDPLNPGKWTLVQPNAPHYIVIIGSIVVKHQNVGVVHLQLKSNCKLTELADVNGTEPVDGSLLVYQGNNIFDFTENINDYVKNDDDIFTKVDTLTIKSKQLTGFEDPSSVNITYNSTNRTITLTGTLTAYWQGLPIDELYGSTWTSTAHDVPVGSQTFYLYYNGTGFVWSHNVWTFNDLMIAFVYSNGIDFAIRECHGLMDSYSHEQNHFNIGTALRSGGDISNLVTNSTTVGNRRPIIAQTTVSDEDLHSVLPALTGSTYSIFSLSSTNPLNVATGSTEIINLSGNQPYFNEFTGGAWQQTLMTNNHYAKIFILAIPVTSDSGSQNYRYLFIQPQTTSLTLSTIQSLTPSTINLGGLNTIIPEFVYIGEIIIRYTAANWVITSFAKITGNRLIQSLSNGGGYLSVVSVDSTLNGDGTVDNPLGLKYNYGAYPTSEQSVTGGTLTMSTNTLTIITNELISTNTITITQGSSVYGQTNEWVLMFDTGVSIPTITFSAPSGVTYRWSGGTAPTLRAYKSYTISFMRKSDTLYNINFTSN